MRCRGHDTGKKSPVDTLMPKDLRSTGSIQARNASQGSVASISSKKAGFRSSCCHRSACSPRNPAGGGRPSVPVSVSDLD
jgi:hypothetical protein